MDKGEENARVVLLHIPAATKRRHLIVLDDVSVPNSRVEQFFGKTDSLVPIKQGPYVDYAIEKCEVTMSQRESTPELVLNRGNCFLRGGENILDALRRDYEIFRGE